VKEGKENQDFGCSTGTVEGIVSDEVSVEGIVSFWSTGID
jgi:hypothetical protein